MLLYKNRDKTSEAVVRPLGRKRALGFQSRAITHRMPFKRHSRRHPLDQTPLLYAIRRSNVRLALIVLEMDPELAVQKCDYLVEGNSPLHYAMAMGNNDIVRLLIAFGASTEERNARGETPLHVLKWVGGGE